MGWGDSNREGKGQMTEHRVGARPEPPEPATGRGAFTHPMVEWLQPGDSGVLATAPRRSPEGKGLYLRWQSSQPPPWSSATLQGRGLAEPRVCLTTVRGRGILQGLSRVSHTVGDAHAHYLLFAVLAST